MKLWRKISPETGMFIEDVLLDDQQLLETGEPDPAYIETPVPTGAGFWRPRWDGAEWVEGLTAEEITARQAEATPPVPTPEERLAALEAAMLEMILGGDPA